jgi:L-amino acid N-acyltransferase YncA
VCGGRRGASDAQLDILALRAVTRWQFDAAQEEGKPQPSRVTVGEIHPAVMRARAATPADLAAIAAIYNDGIDDRVATFETRHRTADDITSWLGGRHPVIVVDDDGEIVAFASTSTYRPRDCYGGVAEFSVYVARDKRGRGYGRAAMTALCDAAARAGFWKLVSRVFVENTASRELMKSMGFREVGIYERHAQLDGVWRDVVIVEKRLGYIAGSGTI